ncbi:LamG-like jellyroll fold domain-containing protein [Catellatospora sp. NPDC049111]|uniref:LamG-like jellyroll fold domain-containing protein n=1 Tax=Catellatospora sp. NPDC049111 TaxID=3155271 RepID=UPI0033E30B0B
MVVAMVAGMAPFGATPAVAVVQECASGVDTEAAALEMAARCGQPVEIVSARTPWEFLSARPDGQLTWTGGVLAERTKVDGTWRAVDTTVTVASDAVKPVAPVLPMSFSPGGDRAPLARIEHAGRSLEVFWPLGALPPPTVAGPQVTYMSVLPDVDLVLTVDEDATGFSQVLVVHTAQAAANPALARISFPVRTSAGLTVAEADGGLTVTDAAGQEVFDSPTPIMWDSSGAVAGVQAMAMRGETVAAADRAIAPLDGDQVTVMGVDVSTSAVTITPDQAMLADTGTSWPVYIDPAWDAGEGVSLNERQMIAEAWPTERSAGTYYNFTSPSGVGLCSTANDSTCNSTGRKRLIYEFNIPAGIRGAKVSSAEFKAYKTSQWSCSDTSWVRLYRVNSITASTNWSNHYAHWNEAADDGLILDSHAPRVCTGWENWDATSGAAMAADNSWTSLTLGLRSTNETYMAGNWRKFRSDATLSITFNSFPNTPVKPWLDGAHAVPKGTDEYWVRDTTPTLYSTVTDPDNDNVKAKFTVYYWGSSTVAWEGTSPSCVASGSTVSTTVSTELTQGTSYYIRVVGIDCGVGGLQSKTWSDYIRFTPDITEPGTPGATAQSVGTGIAAQYSENSWAGGIGQVGKFQFTPAAGTTDTDRYRYSFDSATYTAEVDADAVGNSADLVSYTPSAPGLHTLRVWGVDQAGWVTASPKVYNFYVYATAKSAWWNLDGNGTDSVTSNPNPLTTTGTVSWTDGIVGPVPDDKALLFNGTDTGANTAGAVVHTTGSYTVAALVKPVSAAGPAMVVSQDGLQLSGFRLGVYANASCPVGFGSTCWGLSAPTSDNAAAPGWVYAMPAGSDQFRILPGEWTALAAVYDSAAHELRLYINGVLAGTTSYTATWDAVGRFRVGYSVVNGTPDFRWNGEIDDVRVYKVALDPASIFRISQGSRDGQDVPQ